MYSILRKVQIKFDTQNWNKKLSLHTTYFMFNVCKFKNCLLNILLCNFPIFYILYAIFHILFRISLSYFIARFHQPSKYIKTLHIHHKKNQNWQEHATNARIQMFEIVENSKKKSYVALRCDVYSSCHLKCHASKPHCLHSRLDTSNARDRYSSIVYQLAAQF